MKRIGAICLILLTLMATLLPGVGQAASAKAVKVRAIRLSARRVKIDLTQTDSYQLKVKLRPASAKASSLQWASSNESIATVDENGLVRFHAAGDVRVRAKAPSGKKASCLFRVTGAAAEAPATQVSGTRRALVIGEGRKATVAGTFRLAELAMVPDEVQGIQKMLSSKGIKTTSVVNSTRANIVSAIETAFQGAGADDLNILYMICHGGVTNTGTYLMFPCNNGYLSAKQLRTMLDKIPGRFVILLGCCQSGTVISKGADGAAANAADGFAEAFLSEGADGDAVTKSGELIGDKYAVLCACTGEQNGYGIVSYSSKTGKYLYGYNLFGYAVGLAGGWDLLNGKSVSPSADANGDGGITMKELYENVRGKVSALYEQYVGEGVFSANESQTVTMRASDAGIRLF